MLAVLAIIDKMLAFEDFKEDRPALPRDAVKRSILDNDEVDGPGLPPLQQLGPNDVLVEIGYLSDCDGNKLAGIINNNINVSKLIDNIIIDYDNF